MNDAEWIKSLDNVIDPYEVLDIILENEAFLGYDPYYADLRRAMLDMAKRVSANRVTARACTVSEKRRGPSDRDIGEESLPSPD